MPEQRCVFVVNINLKFARLISRCFDIGRASMHTNIPSPGSVHVVKNYNISLGAARKILQSNEKIKFLWYFFFRLKWRLFIKLKIHYLRLQVYIHMVKNSSSKYHYCECIVNFQFFYFQIVKWITNFHIHKCTKVYATITTRVREYLNVNPAVKLFTNANNRLSKAVAAAA